MNHATIYALCDSRIADIVARVRYVGQTRIPIDQRLRRHHVTALAGAREHRAAWMRSVMAGGGAVLIVAIDRVQSDQVDAAEQAHIARFRALGCDLTNRTDGGRGRRGWVVSSETSRKMSQSASRRKASVATRQKMSAAILASQSHREHLTRLHRANRRPCFTETRRRISAALSGEGNGQNVLTWVTVARIRECHAAGAVQSHLASEFKCSPATICAVVRNRRWVPA